MPTALLTMEDSHHFSANLSHAQDSGADSLNTTEKTTGHPTAADSVLNVALGDHDAQLLDAALDFPFDTELSPILEPFADATVAVSPLKMQRRQSKSPRPRSSPLRRAPTVTTPRQVSRLETTIMTNEETAPFAVTKRPRTRSSSWQEQEQNTFFTMFKVKWPPTPEGEPVPPFTSLLLQRFDAISTKVRTKSVMEVRQFYTTVMQHISELLAVVENDINLTNPDQVRIAVWCWSKLMADKKHSEEFHSLDSEPATVKTNLANLLLQSIIRSRRQMLKAKSDSSTSTQTPGLTSISAWVSRSNLSSFFAKGNVPVTEASSVQIHHPMVRKKHSGSQGQVALMPPAGSSSVTENTKKVLSTVQPNCESPRGVTLNTLTGTKGAVLCFFQKNGAEKWSKDDSNVTCFDIWKHCGKQTNDENVVEVSYLWKVPGKTDPADDENVHVQELMPLLAPPGLFDQEVSTAVKQALSSGDESETVELSPARGLQEFGQKVAFDRSITDEAKEEAAALEALMSDSGDEGLGEEYSPTTGRLRRRIKPVLVSRKSSISKP
ncbi:hypothetical protein GQ600_16606 [Phytophthora cactorum]|nr:hypothetical protein GQ600_16606 [Phytophthora cactorum]